MKKYIIPTTQTIALETTTSCMIDISIKEGGTGNVWNGADSPQRQFTGDYYSSLKYLI